MPGTYPRAIRVFSEVVITFKSGRTPFAHEAIYKKDTPGRFARLLGHLRAWGRLRLRRDTCGSCPPLKVSRGSKIWESQRLQPGTPGRSCMFRPPREAIGSESGNRRDGWAQETYEHGLSVDVNVELVVEGLRGAEVCKHEKKVRRAGRDLLLARGRIKCAGFWAA